jgi:chorismate--pyruvate lyase
LKKSVLYSTEPDWKTNHPGTHRRLPEQAASWIYEPESITRRLRCLYNNQVNVELLLHQHGFAFISENQLLGQSNYHYSLIREVILKSNRKPLILARPIIPIKTLHGAQKILSRLGNKPLGEVIFSYPKLQRLEMQVCKIEPSHWLPDIKNRIDLNQSIWARRTIYAIKNRQLLVSEYFLPEITESIENLK